MNPALLAAAALLAASPAAPAEPRLEVSFLAVGQGDAAFAVTPSGRTLLVDAGPPEAAGSLARHLRTRLAGPIDVVVLSHPHADHLGGMRAALSVAGARHFYDPVLDHPSPLLADLYRLVGRLSRGGSLVAHRVRAGVTAPVDFGDGARLEFLAPEEPLLSGTRSDLNANSVVCLLRYREVAVLFTGDSERPTEARLLAAGSGRLRATVLKVSHHGSRYGSRASFLRAVEPRVAVVSAGSGNRYGAPSESVLDRLERAGARVYRTDRDGTVRVSTDGRTVSVETLGPLP